MQLRGATGLNAAWSAVMLGPGAWDLEVWGLHCQSMARPHSFLSSSAHPFPRAWTSLRLGTGLYFSAPILILLASTEYPLHTGKDYSAKASTSAVLTGEWGSFEVTVPLATLLKPAGGPSQLNHRNSGLHSKPVRATCLDTFQPFLLSLSLFLR